MRGGGVGGGVDVDGLERRWGGGVFEKDLMGFEFVECVCGV